MGKGGPEAIHTVLFRLVERGKIRRLAHGFYGRSEVRSISYN